MIRRPRIRDSLVRIVASLDRKRLGARALIKGRNSCRGVFDKETRRKPLALAADADWEMNASFEVPRAEVSGSTKLKVGVGIVETSGNCRHRGSGKCHYPAR